MKSYDVTIQMKALCLYLHMMPFVFQNFRKFGNLVEICFLLNLAVKGLILDFAGNLIGETEDIRGW